MNTNTYTFHRKEQRMLVVDQFYSVSAETKEEAIENISEDPLSFEDDAEVLDHLDIHPLEEFKLFAEEKDY